MKLRQYRKSVFIVSFLFGITLCLNAYDVCIDGIYYQTVANKAFVTYKGFDENTFENLSNYRGHITIPSTINYAGKTYAVTSIGESAFASSPDLLSIQLPNTIRFIGGASFFDCPQLSEFDIPESVLNVGESAFACCTNLKTCKLPKNMSWLREMSFYMCAQLTELSLPANIDSIGERCLEHCNALSAIYCYAEQVPKADSTIFKGLHPESCTLYVPLCSLDKYEKDNVWGHFGQIIALEDEEIGIQGIKDNHTEVDKTYNIDGTSSNGQHGIRIIQYSNGQTQKVLIRQSQH